MILRLDAQERRYFKIREQTRGMTHEDAIELLENLQAQETEKLAKYLEGKKGE
jgi:hypothetical protein